jgi:hypothetical protein
MKSTPLHLLLLLAWATLGFTQSAPQWRLSQGTDAARTYTYTRFTLAGKFLTSPPQGHATNHPSLVVDCIPAKESPRGKGTFLTGNLLVGIDLKILYVEPEEIRGTSYYQKVEIRYHTDTKDEQQDKWSAGNDKDSASIPRDALKDILHAHTLAITADDAQGSQIAMQFDIPDPTPVEEACNVDEP